MTRFQQSVINIVNFIPKGKVVSYGQVALYAGLPRVAREVGWTLRSLPENIGIPWWRVINNEGRISIKGNKNADAEMQKRRLEQEGVEVSDLFEIDIEKYRWTADKQILKSFRLDDDYIETVLKKYSKVDKQTKQSVL